MFVFLHTLSQINDDTNLFYLGKNSFIIFGENLNSKFLRRERDSNSRNLAIRKFSKLLHSATMRSLRIERGGKSCRKARAISPNWKEWRPYIRQGRTILIDVWNYWYANIYLQRYLYESILCQLYNKNYLAEETGFEPARALLRAQRDSNPPQWAELCDSSQIVIIPYDSSST